MARAPRCDGVFVRYSNCQCSYNARWLIVYRVAVTDDGDVKQVRTARGCAQHVHQVAQRAVDSEHADLVQLHPITT